MDRNSVVSHLLFILLFLALSGLIVSPASSANSKNIPVKGMVTMVDLGAASCIPCKMMEPILTRLEIAYRGKAAIVFIDLRYDKKPAERFGIRAIPTQIFFDGDGKEVYRHEGFMSEEAIMAQLASMGVQ